MTNATEIVQTRYSKACSAFGCRPNKTLSKSLMRSSLNAVTKLDLNVNVVGKNGANAIIELASALPSLTHLMLADNYLNNENVALLVKLLANHPSLQEIDLRSNPISHAAGKALSHFASQNKKIVAIHLDGTLINPALIKIISATCERNRNPPPAPRTPVTTSPAVEEKEQPPPPQPPKEESASPQPAPPSVPALVALAPLVSDSHAAVRVMLEAVGIAAPMGSFSCLAILHASENSSEAPRAAANVLWAAALDLREQDEEPLSLEGLAAVEGAGGLAGLSLLIEASKPAEPAAAPEDQMTAMQIIRLHGAGTYSGLDCLLAAEMMQTPREKTPALTQLSECLEGVSYPALRMLMESSAA